MVYTGVDAAAIETDVDAAGQELALYAAQPSIGYHRCSPSAPSRPRNAGQPRGRFAISRPPNVIAFPQK